MTIEKTPETEGLAAIQALVAIAGALRGKGLLSTHDIEDALKTASFAMHNSHEERVQEAARVVDEIRVELLRD